MIALPQTIYVAAWVCLVGDFLEAVGELGAPGAGWTMDTARAGTESGCRATTGCENLRTKVGSPLPRL